MELMATTKLVCNIGCKKCDERILINQFKESDMKMMFTVMVVIYDPGGNFVHELFGFCRTFLLLFIFIVIISLSIKNCIRYLYVQLSKTDSVSYQFHHNNKR